MNIIPSLSGQELNAWLVFVVGGIVGMCLMVIIFDWTLIIISSLLGATLIVKVFHGTEVFSEVLVYCQYGDRHFGAILDIKECQIKHSKNMREVRT